MRSQKIDFSNQRGQRLTGLLDWPDEAGPPKAYALFAHCFTCSKNLKAAVNISTALAAEGIAVLRFDFTGLGQSEGDFAETTFSSNVEDLVSAAEYLAAEHAAPTLLIGHSLGGTAVLKAAPSIESSLAVATIGSPSRAAHVAHLIKSSREAIERDGEAEVLLAGRPFRIRREFLDDLATQPLPAGIRDLRQALLVLHSPADETVGIENAAEIFEHALHPKSFVSLDHADHLLSMTADSRYVGQLIAVWAAKYLDATGHSSTSNSPSGDQTLVRARTPKTGFRTELSVAGHRLIADEPVSFGGTDTGPSPYDLLAAALASCTTMTLQVYARHKKLPLEAVVARVRHDRIHAADCEACETQVGKIDRFIRTILPEGPLSEPQRSKLLEIADKCPVHRTLESEVLIETRLANGSAPKA